MPNLCYIHQSCHVVLCANLTEGVFYDRVTGVMEFWNTLVAIVESLLSLDLEAKFLFVTLELVTAISQYRTTTGYDAFIIYRYD